MIIGYALNRIGANAINVELQAHDGIHFVGEYADMATACAAIERHQELAEIEELLAPRPWDAR